MALRAIIFDLDGTLADTESLHLEAFNAVLSAEGIEIARGDYLTRLIGYNDSDCFTLLMREYQRPAGAAKISQLIARKAAIYQNLVGERDVVFPGAREFVRRCAERFPLALVTGTLRAEAEMILGQARIRNRFSDIIAAEDVRFGKPEPDGFIAALTRLSLRMRPALTARECLAIEDTEAGVAAAMRAGMRVLAVCQTASAAQLAAADIVRPSLAETELEELLRFLALTD